MAVAITFLLAVLATLPGQTQDPQVDLAIAQRMQQHAEFLHQEMSRLWQEVEQRALAKAFLHAVFDLLSWATVAAVLLQFCMQKQLGSSSCPEQKNCSSKEDNKEDDNEEDEDLKGAQNAARSLAWPALFLVQELPDLSRNLKQLLGDFLINRDMSQNALTPKISPHTGMNSTREFHKN
ncbi:hypothetical protein DUI87_09644 [Hirundo rustica rustica]|uniref:Uncharacterized protein n=1 Tax=Hirundo rustica rustica TaxID=333673 RepID=A0A3M0L5J3_HIRRU|nr:hypothetical protein DUI87_09644 [Hirundo rustica rustica]